MNRSTPYGVRTTELLAQLSLDEKAAITAGSGFFEMTGVTRLGIPNWKMTDGPNGARGSSFFGSGEAQATCIPCGSALGATWNPALVEELGALLGREARTKASRVLLAPTVNLHRSPLAGRNFECFSEDPLLSGKLAAAYVRGVQSEGVIATVKHFVGNECETNRNTSNSIIDDRALRELYLVPFEMAVRDGGALGIMTAYNRLNGTYCSEEPWLIRDLLRDEWGFTGFVTSDWFSAADTITSADAGMNLEMPAGDRAYGATLAAAVRDGLVAASTLDELAGGVLSAMEHIGAWDDEPRPERSTDEPAHRDLARRAATDAMVLLRNEPVDGAPVLPLRVDEIGSVAIIGPNAARAQISGGGSASLRPFHRTTPLEALRSALGDRVAITHAAGCDIDQRAPLLSGSELVAPTGDQGFAVEVFDNTSWFGDAIATTTRDTSRLLFGDEPAVGIRLEKYSARATATYTPGSSGIHHLQLVQVSPTRVLLDGDVVVDGISDPPSADVAFFGHGAQLTPVPIELDAGREHQLVVEFTVEEPGAFAGLEVRIRAPFPPDALDRAVAAAADADIAVVVVGTNDDWETEGEDRTSLALPGTQDDLIAAVAAVNSRTIVVVNTGSPVSMPWVDDVPAILQSWFGGQEMAHAMIDVLTGAADPGGRLPTSFPVLIEHTPAFGSFPGDNDRVPYTESVHLGYRWYDSRHLPVLFPFGHGLSYTTFSIGQPELSATSMASGDTMWVDVSVTNTGSRAGSHVIQCYVRPNQARLVRPSQELKAFAKVSLEPGESTTVQLELSPRSFAYWDPGQPDWPELRDTHQRTLAQLKSIDRPTEPGWTIEPGNYTVVVGNSATDAVASATVRLTD